MLFETSSDHRHTPKHPATWSLEHFIVWPFRNRTFWELTHAIGHQASNHCAPADHFAKKRCSETWNGSKTMENLRKPIMESSKLPEMMTPTIFTTNYPRNVIPVSSGNIIIQATWIQYNITMICCGEFRNDKFEDHLWCWGEELFANKHTCPSPIPTYFRQQNGCDLGKRPTSLRSLAACSESWQRSWLWLSKRRSSRTQCLSALWGILLYTCAELMDLSWGEKEKLFCNNAGVIGSGLD